MKRFLVVGDVNVDIVLRGLPSLPIPGREILCEDFSMLLGGSAANCARWLAGLGAHVDFWGKVGGDALGEFAIQQLAQCGIDTSGVIVDSAISTGVCVALPYAGDRALLTYMGTIDALTLAELPLDRLGDYTHLHSASIFLQRGLQPGFADLFRAAKEAGLTTSLDSGWDPEERWQVDAAGLLSQVDIFLPNEVEALHIARTSSVEEAAAALSQYAGMLVVKRGRDGALAQTGEAVHHAPAFEIDVVDTTGAGDCFNAGFLYARVEQGRALPDALRFANACGAIGATTPGASVCPPAAAEIDRFIEQTST